MITFIAFCILWIGFFGWRYSLNINDRRRPQKPDRKRGITVLKPCKGADDPGFVTNIFSFMEQDWVEEDELVFCFEDESDPAIALIDGIIRRYPHVPARTQVSFETSGVNPKIKTIYWAYREAKNDLILISDSNVRVPYNYLNLVDYEHDNETGVLTAAIIGIDCWSFWSKVEAMLLQKFYNKWLLLGNAAGHSLVMGKSMAFSKMRLEDIGGLDEAFDYLAEDYRIGELIYDGLGYPTKLMSIPVATPLGRRSMRDVFDRYVRWGRMRKAQVAWAFYLEIFSTMTFVSTMLSLTKPWWVCTIMMTLWAFFECQMIRRITGRKPFALAYLVSEWIIFPIWFLSLIRSTVEWRGRTFKMLSGGKCKDVTWGIKSA